MSTDQQLYDEWKALLTKELKGQSLDQLGFKIAQQLEAHPLPQLTRNASRTQHAAKVPIIIEMIAIEGGPAAKINAHILNGLSRGSSGLYTIGVNQESSVFNEVDLSILTHDDGVYLDDQTIQFESFTGFLPKDLNNFYYTDIDILNRTVLHREKNDKATDLMLFIEGGRHFAENIVRYVALRKCLEEIAQLDGELHIDLTPICRPRQNENYDESLIASTSTFLSFALCNPEKMIFYFDQEYFNNPWPEKYIRALRSIPLLVQHESELFQENTSPIHGSHYIEQHAVSYAELLWAGLQEQLKSR